MRLLYAVMTIPFPRGCCRLQPLQRLQDPESATSLHFSTLKFCLNLFSSAPDSRGVPSLSLLVVRLLFFLCCPPLCFQGLSSLPSGWTALDCLCSLLRPAFFLPFLLSRFAYRRPFPLQCISLFMDDLPFLVRSDSHLSFSPFLHFRWVVTGADSISHLTTMDWNIGTDLEA